MPGTETTVAGAADLANRRLVHLAHQTQLIDNGTLPTVPTTQYVGWAEAGSNTGPGMAAPIWRIMRVIYDANSNPTSVDWAGGTLAYMNIWNNRASLPYS